MGEEDVMKITIEYDHEAKTAEIRFPEGGVWILEDAHLCTLEEMGKIDVKEGQVTFYGGKLQVDFSGRVVHP